jgi:predicted CopG family antitoxin
MTKTIDIDDDLYERLQRRALDNEFDSTKEYCQTVLEIVVDELESDAEDAQAEVEDRLEDLGYLN